MNKVIIYTDGAVSGNGKDNAKGGWGAVILFNNEIINKISGSELPSTNQRMELTAALEALNEISKNNYDFIEINTDSAYLCNCYNQKWYVKWLQNGFINSKKQPIANIDLWLPLINYFKEYGEKLQIIKVKAHTGNYYNEMVDKLAVAARQA